MRFSPRSVLPVVALSLALTGCSGGGDPDAELAEDAPAPVAVEELPSPVQSLVTTTDVGQYLGTPNEGVSDAEIESTLAALRQNAWVQTAERREDGVINLEFKGDPPAEERQKAVTQLAAIATIEEGV